MQSQVPYIVSPGPSDLFASLYLYVECASNLSLPLIHFSLHGTIQHNVSHASHYVPSYHYSCRRTVQTLRIAKLQWGGANSGLCACCSAMPEEALFKSVLGLVKPLALLLHSPHVSHCSSILSSNLHTVPHARVLATDQ